MTKQKHESFAVKEHSNASSSATTDAATAATATTAAVGAKAQPRWWRMLLENVVVLALLLVGFTFLFMVRATPLVLHEIFGLVVVAVVLVHVYLLRSFFSFVRGQKQAVFIYRDLVLLGLVVSLVLTVWSGLCISHVLFKGVFISHENFGLWRRMHTFASTYLLLFIGLHLGCYVLRFISWLSESLVQSLELATKSNVKSHAQSANEVTVHGDGDSALAGAGQAALASQSHYAKWRLWLAQGLWVGLVLISINGIIQSVQGSLYSHLLCQRAFSFYDYERLWVWNVVDQLSIVVLFMVLSGLLYGALLRCSQPQEQTAKAQEP